MTVTSTSSRHLTGRGIELAMRITREGKQTALWLNSEHDIATADVVASARAKAIATDDANVIVDLRAVEFLGAAPIHLLRRGRVLLRRQGRRMTLRFPSKCAPRVLALCDLPLSGDPIPHFAGHGLNALSAARDEKSPSMAGSVRSGG